MSAVDSSIAALGAAADQSQKDIESVNQNFKMTVEELEVRIQTTIVEMNTRIAAMSAQSAQALAASDVFQHVPWVPGATMGSGTGTGASAAAAPTPGLGGGHSTAPTLHANHPAGTWSWRLFDEKYLQRDEHFYDQKNPQGWLLGAKDYLAGRTHDVEGFIDWIENQTEPIDENSLWNGLNQMMDQDPHTVSRQV